MSAGVHPGSWFRFSLTQSSDYVIWFYFCSIPLAFTGEGDRLYAAKHKNTLANARGVRIIIRDVESQFESDLPDQQLVSNEELVVGICQF